MRKANPKVIISLLLTLSCLLLAACSSPEAKKAKRLQQAAELQAAGDLTTALATLDRLSAEYPNDSEILRQIGTLHQQLGNRTEAAFYLSAAYNLRAEDVELLYQAYRAQEQAQQTAAAGQLLEALLKAAPDAMNAELWRRLGQLRAEANDTQAALEAFLESVGPLQSATPPETAVAIGSLFKQLNNLPQAERWFSIAANTDDPNALAALFGLLEIQHGAENWNAAKATVTQLDQQFPGALEASQWAEVRTDLQSWHSAQAAAPSVPTAATPSAPAATENAASTPEPSTKAAAASDAPTEAPSATAANTPTVTAEAPATDEAHSSSSSAPASLASGKAQIISDLEHAEALAHSTAVEPAADAPAPTGKTIRYDPSIAIEPAEPELGITVQFDQQTAAPAVNLTVAPSQDDVDVEAEVEVEPSLPAPASAQPTSLTQLLADAAQATSRRDFTSAISLYWQALGRANQQAHIWNKLSNVYLMDGQRKHAETTALEAIRLAPEQSTYTLDYLRVIQYTKQNDQLLAELQQAYERFPRSPAIVLSLARGQERIGGNNSAARALYQRFIELAPNHPLRAEAETALSRLP